MYSFADARRLVECGYFKAELTAVQDTLVQAFIASVIDAGEFLLGMAMTGNMQAKPLMCIVNAFAPGA